MQPFGKLRPSPWNANLFKLPANGSALAAAFAARSDASVKSQLYDLALLKDLNDAPHLAICAANSVRRFAGQACCSRRSRSVQRREGGPREPARRLRNRYRRPAMERS